MKTMFSWAIMVEGSLVGVFCKERRNYGRTVEFNSLDKAYAFIDRVERRFKQLTPPTIQRLYGSICRWC